MPRLPRLPRPTVRLRLTLLYAAVFLVTGSALLALSYALVSHNLAPDRGRVRREVAARLGLPPQLLAARPSGAAAAQLALRQRAVQVFREAQKQQTDAALQRLITQYLLVFGGTALVSVGGGWLLAGRTLRPLKSITATAKRVSEQNLHERIALTGPADELKELADTFDMMLARLDAAFISQRRFVADASHELRTPLALMRAEVDVALADPHADVARLRAMGEGVRAAVERSDRLIESLLTLARSQAAVIAHRELDLAALASSALAERAGDLRSCGLELRASLGGACVVGDPALLERMVANLLDNAIRHNDRGGWIEISTATRDAGGPGGDGGGPGGGGGGPAGQRVAGCAELMVANGGPPLTGPIAELLEPFRRGRAARTGVGFGLGLSIVRSVVDAHGGTIVLQAPPAGGLRVTIQLPRAAVAALDEAPAMPDRAMAPEEAPAAAQVTTTSSPSRTGPGSSTSPKIPSASGSVVSTPSR